MPSKKKPTPGRRHLIGSSWSAAVPEDREKHFRVVGVRTARVEGESVELVELEAVLSGRRREVPREALADPGQFLPDWR